MPVSVWELPLIEIDFEVGTNEDWIDSIQLRANDGVTPLDITGIKWRLQVRKSAPDHTVLIDAASDDSTILAGSGVIGMLVPEDTMQRIQPGAYVHDLIAFDAIGRQARVAYGNITVVQGVTR